VSVLRTPFSICNFDHFSCHIDRREISHWTISGVGRFLVAPLLRNDKVWEKKTALICHIDRREISHWAISGVGRFLVAPLLRNDKVWEKKTALIYHIDRREISPNAAKCPRRSLNRFAHFEMTREMVWVLISRDDKLNELHVRCEDKQ
jgi:hypothetical protein